MSDGPKRLYRSRDQRMLLGVCGGLGEYFDIDPTLVRIVFVVFTLLTAVITGVIVYLVLVIIIPDESKAHLHPKVAARATIDEGVAGTKDTASRATGWVQQKVKSTSSTGTGTAGETGSSGTAHAGSVEELEETEVAEQTTTDEVATSQSEAESSDDTPSVG